MNSRTTPIILEISQYRKFVKDHPGAQAILTAPVFNEHGSRIDLLTFRDDKVYIYVDEIPDDRKARLGVPDLRHEIEKFGHKSQRGLLFLSLLLAGILMVVGWGVKSGIFHLPLLTPTPTPLPKLTEFRIRGVIMQDMSGAILHPLNGTYSVNPQEKVMMKVESEEAAGRNVRFEYQAILGKIGADAIYIAPNKPGSMDLVTVRALDKTTGIIIAQLVIKIKIIATK